MAETAYTLRDHERRLQRLRGNGCCALPHRPRRMKPPLAAAYVDESERALPLRQQHQREPSDQDIAEFPAENSMLGVVLLVYELPRPGLRKLTSGAEVLKENARLKPLVEATQAAVEERGRTLDKD